MKNLKRLTFLLCCSIFIWSCSNDEEQLQLQEVSSSTINTPENGAVFVLNPEETATNTAITFSWEKADYANQTEVNYTLQFAAAGTEFAEPINVATTTSLYFTMNILELNSASAGAGLSPYVEGNIDFRIKSDVGTQNVLPQYSETRTIAVTTFTTELPKIAVPGNHQGWDPPSAPLLAASAFGETDYEGYVWLDGGHKFIAPDASLAFNWGNTDWGDDGSFTGKLLADGEVDCNAAPGYYFVKVDTAALTYSESISNWGIIGSATPSGWDNDTDMTYDAATKTWRINISLTAGGNEIKFRANDAWDVNYGDTGADGMLDNGGDNIAVPATGNYTVVLDFSNPREYSYSLIPN